MNKESEKKTYTLQNLDLYLSKFPNYEVSPIVQQYIDILRNFLGKFSQQTIFTNTKNMKHSMYILMKGMEGIHTIFYSLLLYTKNIDVVYDYCMKSVVFFIEFITQMKQSHEVQTYETSSSQPSSPNDATTPQSMSFIQLNTKDALLFMYRNTIYTIEPTIRETYTSNHEDKVFIQTIQKITQVYTTLLYMYYENYIETEEQSHPFNKYVIHSIFTNITNHLQKIMSMSNYHYECINTIYILSKQCFHYHLTQETIYYIIDTFIKKIIKLNDTSIDFKHIHTNIYKDDFEKKLNTYTPLKLVNYLFHI